MTIVNLFNVLLAAQEKTFAQVIVDIEHWIERQEQMARTQTIDETTLRAMKETMGDLLTMYIRHNFVEREIVPACKKYLTQASVEEIKEVHTYNYNKLSIEMKFK